MENQIKQKLEYLHSIGLMVEDHDNINVAFNSCSEFYDIDFDDFEIGDPAHKICERANQYSCCGDILDKDYMICPTCQEHC